MRSDKNPDDFLYKKDRCRDHLNSVIPKEDPSGASTRTSPCRAFNQGTTEPARAILTGKIATLQTFGGWCRRSTPTTSFAFTPTRQEVSRDAASPCRRRGGTSATQFTTATARLATIRTTAATLRQSASRISDIDNGSTSSEVDISPISQSLEESNSRGESCKRGAHTTYPPPPATPIAAPGQQTGLMATSTSPKSVLRVFLGCAARGIFLCKTTPTRSPASRSRQARSSLSPNPPKPKWRRRGYGYSVQPRQQRRRVEHSPLVIYSAC